MTNLNDFTTLVGIDIAKNVFQVHSVNTATGEISNVPVKRDRLLSLFENRAPCLIGMEACGGSQYWARQLTKLGHTVRLMDPKRVKPFVSHNKSDRADAEGIFVALQQGVRRVPVKNDTERDIQTLLTMRTMLVKQRTANVNHVRGLLMEYGIVIPKSLNQFEREIDESIGRLAGDAVQIVIDQLRDTVKAIRESDARIKSLTTEISRLAKATKHGENLLTVPSVGVVTMAHLCVLLADPSVFASGRQFAAFLGLVPMHTGSGGKTINTHIPDRCDKRLRALLVECAHSIARMKHKAPWVRSILAKKPKKVALIAIANRLARQCWAVASKNQPWRMPPTQTA